MLKTGESILADIDTTLDQLIENAEVLKSAPLEALYDSEIEALQKTQESLLAHLIHMDQLLDPKRKETLIRKEPQLAIHEKIALFGKLNAEIINDVAVRFGAKASKRPRVHRNRKKIS